MKNGWIEHKLFFFSFFLFCLMLKARGKRFTEVGKQCRDEKLTQVKEIQTCEVVLQEEKCFVQTNSSPFFFPFLTQSKTGLDQAVFSAMTLSDECPGLAAVYLSTLVASVEIVVLPDLWKTSKGGGGDKKRKGKKIRWDNKKIWWRNIVM